MSPCGYLPSPGRRGFTLVELLVVVLIIGILAAIALPRLLGQRTRARNAAAQAAVRHALVAARSYYTQNSESYAGLGPTELKGYESSLSGTEPADSLAPGSGANPQDIWIGNGMSNANPAAGDASAGKLTVLCSASRGDRVYCVRDWNGVASYNANAASGATPANTQLGPFTDNGWGATTIDTSSSTDFASGISASAALYAITAGPDGNLWFTEQTGNRIGRITPSGSVTEYNIPTTNSQPVAITAGPDGNLWFVEYTGNQIGRITPGGSFTEFPLPIASSYPANIVAGPDGNLWFTEAGGDRIGRITTSGSITEWTIPTTGGKPYGITAGPDGNLWFTEWNLAGNRIGRITTSGSITEWSIPTAAARSANITAGPDGNLWFTETGTNQIGRVTTSGSITEYSIPTSGSGPQAIVTGPDDNLWFVGQNASRVGRVTISGSVSDWSTPSGSATPIALAVGPDGRLWFTEQGVNRIGRMG